MRQEFGGIVRLPDTERIYDAPEYAYQHSSGSAWVSI